MIHQNRYRTYFFLVLFLITSLLLVKAEYSLSISYKEALNLFVNHSILSVITNFSIYIFGHSDLSLRAPFILLYAMSSFMMYKITKNYFKYEKDGFVNVVIFMTLPGVLSAALLVNTAIIVIFFTLLYIYYYQKYERHPYVLLPFLMLIDNSFATLFLALFFYSFKTKDKLLLYLSVTLFFLSLYIYGFSTDGRPRGFLIDTVGIYSAIFSPVLFLYFLYAIYKTAFLKEINLIWYISFTALILSIVISFRQRVYIEDFAPFVVIALPLMLKIFLNAYRVRLKEFRKFYNILASITILMLSINIFLTFINKPLYNLLPEPKKHFVYQYHFAKEIAQELKAKKIDNIFFDDKELALRLKFYEIKSGEDYFLSTKEFYNYDEKIVVNYSGKDLYFVFIKKL